VSRQRARLEARETQLAAAEKGLDDSRRELANKQDAMASDLAVSELYGYLKPLRRYEIIHRLHLWQVCVYDG
jgi:hypothetical protein